MILIFLFCHLVQSDSSNEPDGTEKSNDDAFSSDYSSSEYRSYELENAGSIYFGNENTSIAQNQANEFEVKDRDIEIYLALGLDETGNQTILHEISREEFLADNSAAELSSELFSETNSTSPISQPLTHEQNSSAEKIQRKNKDGNIKEKQFDIVRENDQEIRNGTNEKNIENK